MVGKDDLPNAVAINSTIFNFGRILGPAAAGLMISAVGTGWAFVANAASSIAVLTGLVLMRTAELHPSIPVERARGQLREGLRYVRRRSDLMLAMVLVFIIGTFGLNFQLTTALIAKQVFHRDASGYGLLSTAVAVGAFVGAVLAARRTTRPTQLFLVFAALGFSVLEIVAGLMPTYGSPRPAAGADRLAMLTFDDSRELLGAARRRTDDARPGDGALPDVLHGRHAARRTDHRLGGRCVRPAVGAGRRWPGVPARGAGDRAAPRPTGAVSPPAASPTGSTRPRWRTPTIGIPSGSWPRNRQRSRQDGWHADRAGERPRRPAANGLPRPDRR